MNSLFLRLYILIVVSVIGIGVLLNTVWQVLVDERFRQSEHDHIVSIVETQLRNTAVDELEAWVQQYNASTGLVFTIESLNDFPEDLFSAENETLSTLYLENEGDTAVYFKMVDHPKLVKLALPSQSDNEPYRLVLLLSFYGLIALAVFYWIWPLSKDLDRLENAVDDFDRNQWSAKVNLPKGSSIAHLAKAYNRLLEKIKRLVENEKAMTSAISHELRTPLARVRFALQMAKETDEPEHRADQLKSIEDDIAEMNTLISELLSFASLDKSDYAARLEKGDIGTLIQTLIKRLHKNYPNHSISFSTADPTEGVQCDSYLIERAIQNLIVNACKYGRKTVQVRFARTGNNYLVRVEDDGEGVAPEFRDKVFESYFRVSDNKSKGFGLGLAIVRRIMELHQGTAKVQSSQKGGALFELKWPQPEV